MILNKIRKVINTHLSEKTASAGHYIEMYGLFMLIAYPLFYFLWLHQTPEAYENIGMRLVASALCVLLVIRRYWPYPLNKYFSYYWYGVILYCYPFFFAFLTLKNNFSAMWLVSDISAIFFLIILLDVASFFGILLLGIPLAVLYFYVFSPEVNVHNEENITVLGVLASTLGAMVLGILFSYNNERMNKERMLAISSLTTNVARKLRNPLLKATTEMSQLFPILSEMSELDSTQKYQLIQKHIHNIREEINQVVLLVNNFLINSGNLDLSEYEKSNFILNDCIKESIKRFPINIQSKIEVKDIKEQIEIKGNFYLILHVLLNILNNAIDASQDKVTQKISISVLKENNFITVKISNNGKEISKKDLPNIFNCFYTTKENHLGLGLYFCRKIVMYHNGSIECISSNEKTTFILSFPIERKRIK